MSLESCFQDQPPNHLFHSAAMVKQGTLHQVAFLFAHSIGIICRCIYIFGHEGWGTNVIKTRVLKDTFVVIQCKTYMAYTVS